MSKPLGLRRSLPRSLSRSLLRSGERDLLDLRLSDLSLRLESERECERERCRLLFFRSRSLLRSLSRSRRSWSRSRSLSRSRYLSRSRSLSMSRSLSLSLSRLFRSRLSSELSSRSLWLLLRSESLSLSLSRSSRADGGSSRSSRRLRGSAAMAASSNPMGRVCATESDDQSRSGGPKSVRSSFGAPM